MSKIRVRHHGKSVSYIHNDLLNGAFHFRNVIHEKAKSDDRSGMAFDCLACLTMLAFAFEAHLNFYGEKMIDGWKERDKFNVKLKAVMDKLREFPI